jgi:hypothetical protein
MMGLAGAAAFLLAALLFFGFTANSGGGEPGALKSLPSGAMGYLVGSVVLFLASLGLGYVASSNTYVCEF